MFLCSLQQANKNSHIEKGTSHKPISDRPLQYMN